MKISVQKTVMTIILFGVIALSTPVAQADAWGANQAAAVWTWVVNKIGRHIEGVLLGSLKMTAMNLLNSQIGQLIGGGATGAPRFITNWQDALYVDPMRNTQLAMNDFFTLTTRGMASSANYIPARASSGITGWSFSSQKLSDGNAHLNNPLAVGDPFALRAEGMVSSAAALDAGGGNYAQYLQNVGRASIAGGPESMTLQEYGSSPQEIFQKGSWEGFDALVSNPLNNAYGYSQITQQRYYTELERQQEIARTQAIAYQGFEGTGGPGGTITTPGSTIKSLVDNANDFGNKLIAGAANPAELAGSLAAAATSKVINGLVNKGIGMVQETIGRQVAAINNQARAIVGEATSALGPGARFLPEIQRGIAINPDFTSAAYSGGSNGSGESDGLCAGKSSGAPCGNSGGKCSTSSDLGSGLWCINDERECTRYSDNGKSCLGGQGKCNDGQCVEVDTTPGLGLNQKCTTGGCAEGLYCVSDSSSFYADQCRPTSEQGTKKSGKQGLGGHCTLHSDCASGTCSKSEEICILQCKDEEIFDFDKLRCYVP
jgi:hypothetical protein